MPGEPTPAAPTATARSTAAPTSTRPGLDVLAAIGLGGALGSVARYELALAAPVAAGRFPWTTWWINITGSLVLALVATLVVERWPPTRYVRPFVGVGICGGYTTWSTFMTEATLLVRDGHAALAAAYLGATLAGGLAATVAGVWLARAWPVVVREPDDYAGYPGYAAAEEEA